MVGGALWRGGGVLGVGRGEGGRWDGMGWTFVTGSGGGTGMRSGL